jgi:hypothetical protein
VPLRSRLLPALQQSVKFPERRGTGSGTGSNLFGPDSFDLPTVRGMARDGASQRALGPAM